MRWNNSGVAFSRPIRWIVAMYGETVIPFEYAGVTSGSTTRGLRPNDSPEIEIRSAGQYLEEMQRAGNRAGSPTSGQSRSASRWTEAASAGGRRGA